MVENTTEITLISHSPYILGLLEGFLTADLIYQHHQQVLAFYEKLHGKQTMKKVLSYPPNLFF